MIDRQPFEHTARMLYSNMAEQLRDLECPLDPQLTEHGVDGKVVMMTFDKDKFVCEDLKECGTGVGLCDALFSISLTQSRTKVDVDGVKVAPWILDVKCFGLKIRTDIPGFQLNALNACDLGDHGIQSSLDASLEVGDTVSGLVEYYQLKLKGVEGITKDTIAHYCEVLYTEEEMVLTANEAAEMKLVHENITQLQQHLVAAKAHGIDSFKQRTDLGKDVRHAISTAARTMGGGREERVDWDMSLAGEE